MALNQHNELLYSITRGYDLGFIGGATAKGKNNPTAGGAGGSPTTLEEFGK